MIFVLFEIYIDSGVNRPPDFSSEVIFCVRRELKELSSIFSAKCRHLGFQTDICSDVTG